MDPVNLNMIKQSQFLRAQKMSKRDMSKWGTLKMVLAADTAVLDEAFVSSCFVPVDGDVDLGSRCQSQIAVWEGTLCKLFHRLQDNGKAST